MQSLEPKPPAEEQSKKPPDEKASTPEKPSGRFIPFPGGIAPASLPTRPISLESRDNLRDVPSASLIAIIDSSDFAAKLFLRSKKSTTQEEIKPSERGELQAWVDGLRERPAADLIQLIETISPDDPVLARRFKELKAEINVQYYSELVAALKNIPGGPIKDVWTEAYALLKDSRYTGQNAIPTIGSEPFHAFRQTASDLHAIDPNKDIADYWSFYKNGESDSLLLNRELAKAVREIKASSPSEFFGRVETIQLLMAALGMPPLNFESDVTIDQKEVKAVSEKIIKRLQIFQRYSIPLRPDKDESAIVGAEIRGWIPGSREDENVFEKLGRKETQALFDYLQTRAPQRTRFPNAQAFLAPQTGFIAFVESLQALRTDIPSLGRLLELLGSDLDSVTLSGKTAKLPAGLNIRSCIDDPKFRNFATSFLNSYPDFAQSMTIAKAGEVIQAYLSGQGFEALNAAAKEIQPLAKPIVDPIHTKEKTLFLQALVANGVKAAILPVKIADSGAYTLELPVKSWDAAIAAAKSDSVRLVQEALRDYWRTPISHLDGFARILEDPKLREFFCDRKNSVEYFKVMSELGCRSAQDGVHDPQFVVSVVEQKAQLLRAAGSIAPYFVPENPPAESIAGVKSLQKYLRDANATEIGEFMQVAPLVAHEFKVPTSTVGTLIPYRTEKFRALLNVKNISALISYFGTQLDSNSPGSLPGSGNAHILKEVIQMPEIQASLDSIPPNAAEIFSSLRIRIDSPEDLGALFFALKDDQGYREDFVRYAKENSQHDSSLSVSGFLVKLDEYQKR